MRGPGVFQQKILLLLLGGLAIGLSRSPRRAYAVVRQIGKKWRELDRHRLKRAISALYRSRLIEERHGRDGTITLVLSEEGKRRALSYRLDDLRIKTPARWDRKWRVVLFDVPEGMKKLRDAFRFRLRQLGFLELQKSVFVFPYPCEDEVAFVVEFYNARRFVRIILAESIDNALHLKKKFFLI